MDVPRVSLPIQKTTSCHQVRVGEKRLIEGGFRGGFGSGPNTSQCGLALKNGTERFTGLAYWRPLEQCRLDCYPEII